MNEHLEITMNSKSQWVTIVFSTWFTWLIYTSNTLVGTEAQADLVVWITWGLFAVALYSYRLDDDILVRLQHKSHWIKACSDSNVIAQVFLLVITGHWWLALARGITETIIRFQIDKAVGWEGIGFTRR